MKTAEEWRIIWDTEPLLIFGEDGLVERVRRDAFTAGAEAQYQADIENIDLDNHLLGVPPNIVPFPEQP